MPAGRGARNKEHAHAPQHEPEDRRREAGHREHQHKRSIGDDVIHLKLLMPSIGTVALGRLHVATLQP